MVVMFQWNETWQTIVQIGAALSVLIFITTLIVIPVAIARMPQDYFLKDKTPAMKQHRHVLFRLVYLTVKNTAGVFLLVSGMAMLILPGQGLLSILIGVSLINFPGKHHLMRKIARQSSVLKTLNWIRRKQNCPPLLDPTSRDSNDRSSHRQLDP